MPAATPLISADGSGSGGGAQATLSDWQGHFAVQCAADFCNANLQQHAQRNGAMRRAPSEEAEDERQSADADARQRWAAAQQRRHSLGAQQQQQQRRAPSRCDGVTPPAGGGGGGYDRPLSRSGGGGSGGDALRPGLFSRQTTMSASLIGDSMTEIRIEDLPNDCSEPTSALLDYCKRKFLRPYLGILSLVALNPISTDTTRCRAFLSYLQAAVVLALLLFGYTLQYLCSYRGDRGFSNYSNDLAPPSDEDLDDTDGGGGGSGGGAHMRTIGELIFGHVIPNGLSLAGYLTAVLVCKLAGQEQLQNLVERSFLMSMKPRHLCRMLWLCVCGGAALLAVLFAYVVPSVMMQQPFVAPVRWLAWLLCAVPAATKAALMATLLLQDLVEIVILSSYCVECYLLRVHLATLSQKLLMHSIDSQDWMREMLEFRKLLEHLNQRVALPVCFFVVMNLAYAFAGLVYLFKDFDFHYSALGVVVLNIVNCCIWLLLGLAPFFAAASVTRTCKRAQGNGHQIRVRPFVYHNTSAEDLNSTLLFASSLDMSAKLFRMPIQSNYLCFAILVVSIVVLTLGMCVNLIDFGSF